VLELLEGESLYERMVKVRRFDPDFVTRVFSHVCRGLTRAHEANIIHRDLKPENIFITKGEEGEVVAKIVDFGLAKFYAPLDGTPAQQRLTREGAVFGTPAYMSPEQVKGQGQVDHRADLWAIGCMVYECLIGRTVWATEQGVAMIFAQIATADIPVPTRLRNDLPSEFDGWFVKALARDPDTRFQSAKELADELVVALGQWPPSINLTASLADVEKRSLSKPSSGPGSVPHRPPGVRVGGLAANQPPGGAELADDELVTNRLGVPTASPHGAARLELPSQTPSGTADPGSRAAEAPQRRRAWVALLGAIVVGTCGFVLWQFLIRPPAVPTTTTPSVLGSSTDSPTASQRPAVLLPARTAQELPPWAQKLSSGQEMLGRGDIEGARQAFRESAEGTGSGVPRVILENLRIALAEKGPCELAAMGRPRPFDLTDGIRRPDILYGPHGTLVTWADNHEIPGQWHAYTVVLDEHMRSVGEPLDVSPEAASVHAPRLFAADNLVLLLFSDQYGKQPGVYVRRLTTAGRILGAPVSVSDKRSSTVSPSLALSPSGDLWVAFGDDGDKAGSSQLYVRKLSPSVKPAGPPILVGDYAAQVGLHRSRTRAPELAFTGNAMLLAYKWERGREQAVIRQRIPLDLAALKTGLAPGELPRRDDRMLGESKALTDRGARVNQPFIACDATGCFATWREEPRGSSIAFIDPMTGTTIWKKRFAPRGTAVTVALDGAGGGLAAWYEAGRVRVAPLTRDGIEESRAIARLTGDQPRPSVSRGANHGEWVLAWTDYEAGHLEAYTARIVCR
jgi:serine/threonine-protein kinase